MTKVRGRLLKQWLVCSFDMSDPTWITHVIHSWRGVKQIGDLSPEPRQDSLWKLWKRQVDLGTTTGEEKRWTNYASEVATWNEMSETVLLKLFKSNYWQYCVIDFPGKKMRTHTFKREVSRFAHPWYYHVCHLHKLWGEGKNWLSKETENHIKACVYFSSSLLLAHPTSSFL